MVMRWFTRDWTGFGDKELTDAEVADATRQYDEHLRTVLPMLPQPLRELADGARRGSGPYLHDARIETWDCQLPAHVTVQVVSGDLPRGYERLTIQYRGVELNGADEPQVAAWLAVAGAELLYDEVDVAEGGRFEHRHLLWPTGEFAVRFADISLTRAPVDADVYDRLGGGAL